ncbi:MAG: sigma-70 family RNA polymerase sigma factor [Alphaproteobacteria bacterium]|nr:sigma-70 family RNA polymerase sigma factor [Alphaproteobacteria bacterium]
MLDRDGLGRLLGDAAAGDRAAFRAVYDATAPHLLGVALRILRRRDAAEEVVQEAYVSIWQHAGEYRRERGTPIAWMGTIVRNRALDRIRRERATVALDDVPGHEDWHDPDPLPDDATATSQEARRLAVCLDALDAKQRRAIVLAYREGLTHDEIARRLPAPLGTVKTWIRRGLMQLKDCLGP